MIKGVLICFLLIFSFGFVDAKPVSAAYMTDLEIKAGWNMIGMPPTNTWSYSSNWYEGLFNSNYVTTLWTWDDNKWNIYKSDGATEEYAASKGFGVIEDSYDGNEDFLDSHGDKAVWINAKEDHILKVPKYVESYQVAEYGEGFYLPYPDLIEGWNFASFGFFAGVSEPVSVVDIAGYYNDDIISIWSWSAEENKWYVVLPQESDDGQEYAVNKSFGFLTLIEGNKGYWVNFGENLGDPLGVGEKLPDNVKNESNDTDIEVDETTNYDNEDVDYSKKWEEIKSGTAFSSKEMFDPSATSLNSGNILIAYSVMSDDKKSKIGKFVIVDVSGNIVKPETTFSEIGDFIKSISTTTLANGNVLIAYSHSVGFEDFPGRFIILDSSGNIIKPETSFNVGNMEGVSLVTLANGNILVAYGAYVYSGKTLGNFIILDSSGNIVKSVKTFEANYALSISTTILANGNILVAYGTKEDTDSDDYLGEFVIIDSFGNIMKDKLVFTEDRTMAVSVATFGNGNGLITYNTEDEGKFIIVDLSGNIVKSETVFSGDSLWFASATTLADGNILIAYRYASSNVVTGDWSGKFIIVDSLGNILKSSTIFNTGNIFALSTSTFEDGNVLIVYKDTSGSENDDEFVVWGDIKGKTNKEVAKAYIQAITNGSGDKIIDGITSYESCNPVNALEEDCEKVVYDGKDGKTLFMEMISSVGNALWDSGNIKELLPEEDLIRVYRNLEGIYEDTQNVFNSISVMGNGLFSELEGTGEAKDILSSYISYAKEKAKEEPWVKKTTNDICIAVDFYDDSIDYNCGICDEGEVCVANSGEQFACEWSAENGYGDCYYSECDICAKEDADIPSEWDWTNAKYNGVVGNWMTPVKDQSDCGSCYAFAVVGAVEAYLNLINNNPDLDLDLSEQQIVSCYINGNGEQPGCSGGSVGPLLEHISTNGIIEESCFEYEADMVECLFKNDCAKYYTGEVIEATIKDDDNIKKLLVSHGPQVVSYLVTGSDTLIGDEVEDCDGLGSSIFNTGLRHVVTLVGYRDDSESPYGGYWLVKNTWGTSYYGFALGGEGAHAGYFKIGYGQCGFAFEMQTLKLPVENKI